MLSKEEIEKAKGWLSALDVESEFEAISREILLQYIEQLEFQIQVKEKEHKYDVNIIDEVKGESVKLYKEIRQLEQENKALKGALSNELDRDKKTCFYEDGNTGKCLGYSNVNDDEPCEYCESCEALSIKECD